MAYLDIQRFDRLSEDEVLRRIGDLLAIAIGRREGQRLRQELTPSATAGKVDPQRFDPRQLVIDELERQIIGHLRKVGSATSRELAIVLGCKGRTMARKLARLRAAGQCQIEGRSRMACYRLRTEFGAN